MDPVVEVETSPTILPEGIEDLDAEEQFSALAEEILGVGFFLDVVMEAIQDNEG